MRSFRRPCHPGIPESAFTLLELAIAAVVIVVALLGLLAAMAHCARLDAVSAETTIALHGVRERLEIIQAATFSTVAGLKGMPYAIDTTTPSLDRLQPVPGSAKVLTVTVTQVNAGDPNLLEVRVRADWTGVSGVRSLGLRTRIANH